MENRIAIPWNLKTRIVKWLGNSSKTTPVHHVCVRSVAQSCPALCDPMDCSVPGSSVHGDSPAKNTGEGCHALLQGIFLTEGSNSDLLHCRHILYHLIYQGSPRILEWVVMPFSRGSSWPRNQTRVSCITGGLYQLSHQGSSLCLEQLYSQQPRGGFPCGSAGKESAHNVQSQTWVWSLGWGDPLEKGRLPTPVFWPGEFYGLYSTWGLKESDTTEQFSRSLSSSGSNPPAINGWEKKQNIV